MLFGKETSASFLRTRRVFAADGEFRDRGARAPDPHPKDYSAAL